MEIIRGSLDRVEGSYAIVYSDKDGSKFNVPRSMMPDAKSGSKVLLYVEENNVVEIKVDRQATDEALDRIRKKYQKLQKRKS